MKITSVKQLEQFVHTGGVLTLKYMYRVLKRIQYGMGVNLVGCWQVVKIGEYYYGYLDNAHTVGE